MYSFNASFIIDILINVFLLPCWFEVKIEYICVRKVGMLKVEGLEVY